MWCKPTNFQSSTGMIWGYMRNIYCSMLHFSVSCRPGFGTSSRIVCPGHWLFLTGLWSGIPNIRRLDTNHGTGHQHKHFGISCTQTAVGTLTKQEREIPKPTDFNQNHLTCHIHFLSTSFNMQDFYCQIWFSACASSSSDVSGDSRSPGQWPEKHANLFISRC